jgi:hypothetical protein
MRAYEAARLTTDTVFPTPPFKFDTVIMLVAMNITLVEIEFSSDLGLGRSIVLNGLNGYINYGIAARIVLDSLLFVRLIMLVGQM